MVWAMSRAEPKKNKIGVAVPHPSPLTRLECLLRLDPRTRLEPGAPAPGLFGWPSFRLHVQSARPPGLRRRRLAGRSERLLACQCHFLGSFDPRDGRQFRRGPAPRIRCPPLAAETRGRKPWQWRSPFTAPGRLEKGDMKFLWRRSRSRPSPVLAPPRACGPDGAVPRNRPQSARSPPPPPRADAAACAGATAGDDGASSEIRTPRLAVMVMRNV